MGRTTFRVRSSAPFDEANGRDQPKRAGPPRSRRTSRAGLGRSALLAARGLPILHGPPAATSRASRYVAGDRPVGGRGDGAARPAGPCRLIFGRTRRKEAEAFTRSVVTCGTKRGRWKRCSVSCRTDRRESFVAQHITNQLMGLGDEAAARLGTVTRDLEQGSQRLTAARRSA